jgi:hypothetical protein
LLIALLIWKAARDEQCKQQKQKQNNIFKMQFEKETHKNSIIKYSSIRYNMMEESETLIKLNIS